MEVHEIHISKNGKDIENCGSNWNQCQSILFTITTFMKKNEAQKQSNKQLAIMIDGGMKEPWIYEVNQTIQLPSSNVVIKKNPSSVFNPVIVNPNIDSIGNTSKPYHAFNLSENSNISVSIESIDFSELYILRRDNKDASTNCVIVLENSTASLLRFKREKRLKDGFINLTLRRRSFCVVNITQSTFSSKSMLALFVPIEYSGRLKVSVVSSRFINTGIKLMSTSVPRPGTVSSFKMDDVTFTQCSSSPVKVYAILKTFLVTNCMFHDNVQLQRSSIFSINSHTYWYRHKYWIHHFNLTNIIFLKNNFNLVIKIMRTRTLALNNITFTQNNLFHIIGVFQISSINISNIEVSSNTIDGLGLDIKYCTSVSLNKHTWKNNRIKFAAINLLGIRKVNVLKDIELQNNHIRLNAINVILSSISMSRLRTQGNKVNVMLAFRGNKKSTYMTVNVDDVFSANDICQMYWISPYQTFVKVRNFHFVGLNSSNVLYHWAHPLSDSIGIYKKMVFENVTGTLMYIRVKNVHLSDLKVHQCKVGKVLECRHFTNITLLDATISHTTIKESIIFLKNNSVGVYRNLQIFNNTVVKNMIHSERSIFNEIYNLTATYNTIGKNLFMGFETNLALRDILIHENIYATGISILNGVSNISRLSIYNNKGAKELFFGEFYLLISNKLDQRFLEQIFYNYTKILSGQRCWKSKKNFITISDSTISKTLSSPNSTQVSPVAFVTSMPNVVMDNVTINLYGYQQVAFEMYISKTNSGQFKPDLHITCSSGSSPKTSNDTMKSMAFKYEVDCVPCKRDMYSTERGKIHIKEVSGKLFNKEKRYENIDDHTTFTATCLRCTIGGDCNYGKSRSIGNFYRYITPQGNIDYIHCPKNYCYSNSTFSTDLMNCQRHREGVLCGNCKQGYQESVFTTSCIPNTHCTNIGKFWVIFCVIISAVLCLICFFDVFFEHITAIFLKLASFKIHNQENCDDNSSDNYASNDVIQMNNVDDIDQDFEDTNVHQRTSSKSRFSESTSKQLTEKTTTLTGFTPTCFVATTIFNITFSYYQLRSLILLYGIHQNRFSKFFNKLFNAAMDFDFDGKACPYLHLGAVDKSFIKFVVPTFFMLIVLAVLIIALICWTRLFNKKSTHQCALRSYMEVCFSKILLFNYKNIAYFCFVAIHCVSISDESSVLFINGNIKCYQSWQYIAIAVLLIWIIPFPLTVQVANNLYQSHKITYHQNMFCLGFPLATAWYHLTNADNNFVKPPREYKADQFAIVDKIFTEPFNLCNREQCWEVWRLVQRLVLVVISIFVINPLYRVTAMFPCILLFIVIYMKVNPYKERYWVLHWLEITSLLNCFMAIAYSLFHAFQQVYNVEDTEDIETLIRIFSYVEVILSPVVLCFLLLIYAPISVVFQKLKKK